MRPKKSRKYKFEYLDVKSHQDAYRQLRESVSSQDLTFLTGPRGCGKTTLIDRVVQDLEEQDGRIFVRIDCLSVWHPIKEMESIRSVLAEAFDDSFLEKNHKSIRSLADMHLYLMDYELALRQRSSLKTKSIVFIFDHAEALISCQLTSLLTDLWFLLDLMKFPTTLRFVIASNDPDILEGITDKSDRWILKWGYHIEIPSWTKEDSIMLLKEYRPTTCVEDYSKELLNSTKLAFGKHSQIEHMPQVMIRNLQESFGRYLHVRNKENADCVTERVSRFTLEHHANRKLIVSGKTLSINYVDLNLMKISAYIASKTTPEHDKSNFVLFSKRKQKYRKVEKFVNESHFTQERLIKIDTALTHKISGSKIINADKALQLMTYLENQHAIQLKSGDILDSDSQWKLSDFYGENHIIQLARELKLELDQLTGLTKI